MAKLNKLIKVAIVFMQKPILVIDCGTISLDKIMEMINEYEYKTVDMKNLDKVNFYQFSHIVITGSPHLLSKDKSLLDYFSFLKEVKIPVLGICFGLQLIALTYGADIKNGKNTKKDVKIEFLKKDKLFSGLPSEIEFHENHQERVSMPTEFIHLAKSEDSLVEAFKHKTKDIYGVQFHPECSGEFGKIIFENFLI